MINQWLKRWAIPAEAEAELRQLLLQPTTVMKAASSSEAGVQQDLRLKCKGRLWRNNVGVLFDERGTPIRYGLANDSRRVNEKIKSSDLIGITPLTFGGVTVGVFTAIEAKRSSWKYKGTARETAQLKYLNLVRGLGGIGTFAASFSDYNNAIQEYIKQW
jgi:hypothetical protein